MRPPLRVYLKSHRGETVEAQIVEEMPPAEVVQASGSWQSLIEAQRREWMIEQIPHSQWPQHQHWDWERKSVRYGGLLSYRFVGIRHDGEIQGMMLVNLDSRRCRGPAQQGKPLVYVEYLAAAPWNSPLFVPVPLFTGVGTVLMFAAIRLSVDLGYKGRIGLHSLPQADTFYQRCGMTNLGIDPDGEELRYFEMTPEQAEQFTR